MMVAGSAEEKKDVISSKLNAWKAEPNAEER